MGIWGSYYTMPKAIFYLLKGHYNPNNVIVVSMSFFRCTYSLLTRDQVQVLGLCAVAHDMVCGVYDAGSTWRVSGT